MDSDYRAKIQQDRSTNSRHPCLKKQENRKPAAVREAVPQ